MYRLFAFELSTETEIQASAQRVWELLTDFDRMPTWNPYLEHISGELRPGAVLSVRATPSGTWGRTFNPIVLRVEPGRELRWLGRGPLPGLFNGEHIFTLEPHGNERVRLIHREEFSGVFVPFHRLFRLKAARRGFEEMNAALKETAERGNRAGGRNDRMVEAAPSRQ